MALADNINWDSCEHLLTEWNANGISLERQVELMSEKIGGTVTMSALTSARNRFRLKFSVKNMRGFKVQDIPTPNRPVEDVIKDQAGRFREKKARWEVKHDGIKITMHDEGPCAIVLMGDPHVDDDGANIERLCHDMDLVKNTPHCYAANIGDLANFWIRALGHLYGHQHTTDDEAIELVEWLVAYLPWLFIVLGNHDKWSPMAGQICKTAGVTYVSHGAMFKVLLGEREVVIDARHTHKGNSMYNPAHAQVKRNFRGSNADIIVGGHTHQSAYTMIRNGVTGKIAHAIRVGAYKQFDEYADQGNFDNDSISPSVMVVLDPRASQEGLVTVFHNLEHGVRFLESLRI